MKMRSKLILAIMEKIKIIWLPFLVSILFASGVFDKEESHTKKIQENETDSTYNIKWAYQYYQDMDIKHSINNPFIVTTNFTEENIISWKQ
jgi:hypothetical protein